MSPPPPPSSPRSSLPPLGEGKRRGTYSGTPKPVYPADALAPCSFKPTPHSAARPCQGRGAQSSLLCPLPSRSVPPLLFPSREERGLPLGLHGGGLAAFLSPLSGSPIQGWDPGCTPLSILRPSCLCVWACVYMCPPSRSGSAPGHRGRVCAGGRGGESFCLVLPLSLCPWVSDCGCYPHAHTACPVTPAALHPGVWAKLPVRTGSSGRGRAYPPALGNHPPPPARPPEGPWEGSAERITDAQGNTGLLRARGMW